jgi:hypothetical protein
MAGLTHDVFLDVMLDVIRDRREPL